jgi:hypothetical protein
VTYLAARGLGEPQRPLVLKRVLDIEVVLVVEDGDELLVHVGGGNLVVVTIGRDGDRLEVDLVRHFVCGRRVYDDEDVVFFGGGDDLVEGEKNVANRLRRSVKVLPRSRWKRR